MTDEGSLQGEAPLLTPPGSSCADPSSGPMGRSKNARLSTGYGAFSRKGRRGGAPGADFSFASSEFKTLGAFFCNFVTPKRW
jgi:hypothetical protein